MQFLKDTVYRKKSLLSKESDTKILQSIYFPDDVGIITSYSNRLFSSYSNTSFKTRDSQTFYDLVPLGHAMLSTRTTSSRTTNLNES